MSGRSHRVTLVKAAAVHAGTAVARLVELSEPKDRPQYEEVPPERLAGAFFLEGGQGVTVAADLAGAVEGLAGLAFSAEAIPELTRRLLGPDHTGELDDPARSALAELGNIAVSAAAGALGHLASGVVVPSVPLLSAGLPPVLRGARTAPATTYVVNLVIGDEAESLPIQFFWAPPRSS